MTNSDDSFGEHHDPPRPDESTVREELGLPGHRFEDDSLAPPLDWEMLHAYDQGRLDVESQKEVLLRIIRFRPWHEAYTKILTETQ